MSVYNEVKEVHNIIDFVASNTSQLFSVLKIYGSVKTPLYSSLDIAKILEIKNIDGILKQFTIRECINARTDNSDKPIRLLTEHGLYRILFMNNTPLGEIFREFVYMVLDKLKDEGEVKLIDVQKNMQTEFADEIKKATDYLKQRIENLEVEILSASKILRRNTEMLHSKEHANGLLSQNAQNLRMKINVLESRLLRAELNDNIDITSDEALLTYLKNKHMIKYFVYLMPCRDEVDDCYNYNDYSIHNTPEEDSVMYYRISKNDACIKGVVAYELFLENDAYFAELKKRLTTDTTIMQKTSDTVYCDFATLREHYLDVRSMPLVEKKKTKALEIEKMLQELQGLWRTDSF